MYLDDVLKLGITPAGAGKTGKSKASTLSAWDHPRRCGENSNVQLSNGGSKGSPPQVRGKLFSAASLPRWAGITPAGAGKTLCSIDNYVLAKDHPRRCGENTKKIL